MSEPATPYIQFGELRAWLLSEGFKGHTIKRLVQDRTIPRKDLPGRSHAYYHVPAVAAALGIANPLPMNRGDAEAQRK